MEWLTGIFNEPSILQAVVVISLVSAVGLSLGRLRIFGVPLGITFVFFTGILVGHFGVVLNRDMLAFAQGFGLILFVYTLGLQVGPGFFSSFKKGGLRLNMLSLSVILTGTLLALLIYWITGVPISNIIGLLSGAVTNTPALGAAQQTLLQALPGSTDLVTDMALACAITYPLGVVGVILAIVMIRRFSPGDYSTPKHEVKDNQTYVAEYHVSNPAIYNKTIQDVVRLVNKRFVISRIWRKGKVSIPTSDTKLLKDDHILVISSKSDVEAVKVLFGEQENVDWNKEDIDWNADDSRLVSRRVVVTQDHLNGVRLGSLRLRNLYGINITRVNRAGFDLLASPALHLQLGDRLTVVGEANTVKDVVKILGDQEKRLDNPNLIAIFVGIFLGVILGVIPFSFPGINMPIRLGMAGGPIIVGILMGTYGPRLKLMTYTTHSANLMMRQLGIVIYLACLGLDSGAGFFETLFRAEGLLWIGLGFSMTLLPVLAVSFIAYKFFKIEYAANIGMICGSMANPMALTYANSTVDGDEPAVSYATVYPLGMFVRVIIAQLLVLLFF